MTGNEFKTIVNKYGAENVLSIGFDNSASSHKFTDENPFSFDTHYMEDIECLQFFQFERNGLPYLVVKHVENIQTIIFKASNTHTLNDYDSVTIRG